MAYDKHTWSRNTEITSAWLNEMETGIEQASSGLDTEVERAKAAEKVNSDDIAKLKADGYKSVTVEGLTTMAELREYIASKNATGEHFLFDLHNYASDAYVCTIHCYTFNSVNMCFAFDILNNHIYGDYDGYDDDETISDYLSKFVTDGFGSFKVDGSKITTLGELNSFLNDFTGASVNSLGKHLFFDMSNFIDDAYVCTIHMYESTEIAGRKYCFVFDMINDKFYGDYAGYSDETLLTNYFTVAGNWHIKSNTITDKTMTMGTLYNFIKGVNEVHDHLFFDVSGLGVDHMYLATILIEPDINSYRIFDIVTGYIAEGVYQESLLLVDALANYTVLAKVDGYYEDMTVGTAENLIDVDAEPVARSFTTDVAGGTNSIESGIAEIESIQGNTIVYNQLVSDTVDTAIEGTTDVTIPDDVKKNSNCTVDYVGGYSQKWNQLYPYTLGTTSASSLGCYANNCGVSNSDGYLKVTPRGSCNCNFGSLYMSDGSISGHVYLSEETVKADSTITVGFGGTSGANYFTATTSDKIIQVIYLASNSTLFKYFNYCIYDAKDTSICLYIKDFHIFDLTAIFGVTSTNEVTDDMKTWCKNSASISSAYDSGSIKSAKVDKITETGKNLLVKNYEITTKCGITSTLNSDGTITFNGTCTAGCAFNVGIMTVKKGIKYRLTGCPEGGGDDTTYRLWCTSGKAYPLGHRLEDIGSGNTVVAYEDETFSVTMQTWLGTKFDNLIFKPMITTDTSTMYDDFVPYQSTSKDIPDAIQALDGYSLSVSDTVYNYVDFDNKKYHRQVGSYTITGNETWTAFGVCYYASVLSSPYSKTGNTINCICNKLEARYSSYMYSVDYTKSVAVSYQNVYVSADVYTNISSYKGTVIYYSFATEEVTDISSMLDDDFNSFPAEAGGSISYHYDELDNGFNLEVPNKVAYKDTEYSIATDSTHNYLHRTFTDTTADDGTITRTYSEEVKTGVTSIDVIADDNGTGDNLTDLTRMGYSTADELYYDYPMMNTSREYNQGELVSEIATGVKTTGKNLLDKEINSSTLYGVTCTNNGDGTYTVNGTATDTCRFLTTYTFVKGKKYRLVGCPSGGSNATYGIWINIGGSCIDNGNGGIYTPTITGAQYVFIFIQKGTTVSNLVFKPMITMNLTATYDDFEKYEEPKEYQIPITSILDHSGNILFPNGLLSSGTVYDEIYADYAVKRIGVVDLGTLNWSYSSNVFYISNFTKAKPTNDKVIANIICPYYKSVADNKILATDKACSFGNSANQLIVHDSYYGTDKSTFKSAMSGIMLYYELETPITVTFDNDPDTGSKNITEPLNLTYKVESGGLEITMPVDTEVVPSNAPFKANIRYNKNFVKEIVNLPLNYLNEQSVLNLCATLGITGTKGSDGTWTFVKN